MVAFRPDPEKETPLEEQTGSWEAKESLLQDPPRINRMRRALGRRAEKGRIILVDEDQDPMRNPRAEVLSDEQLAVNKAGMRVLRSWRNLKDNADAPAEPEQLVFEELEFVEPLSKIKAAVAEDWEKHESTVADQAEVPPTNYRYFKHRREMR